LTIVEAVVVVVVVAVCCLLFAVVQLNNKQFQFNKLFLLFYNYYCVSTVCLFVLCCLFITFYLTNPLAGCGVPSMFNL